MLSNVKCTRCVNIFFVIYLEDSNVAFDRFWYYYAKVFDRNVCFDIKFKLNMSISSL